MGLANLSKADTFGGVISSNACQQLVGKRVAFAMPGSASFRRHDVFGPSAGPPEIPGE
jgi:hypothetical protein